jgi:hypothetical protein
MGINTLIGAFLNRFSPLAFKLFSFGASHTK